MAWTLLSIALVLLWVCQLASVILEAADCASSEPSAVAEDEDVHPAEASAPATIKTNENLACSMWLPSGIERGTWLVLH